MSKPIKVAVIGVGHLGQHHGRIYHELPDIELVGVCDSDARRGKEIASRFETQYYSSYQEIPNSVEAVSVVTPTVSHFEIVQYFLKKKVHVLVEKPVTTSVEDAQKLEELANDKNLILQVGHIERFNPAWMAVRDQIQEPKFLEIHRLAPFKNRSTDVGVVLDLMIHDIDIVFNIVKKPIKEIRASGLAVIGPNEDLVNCRMEFEGGCVANMTASRISQKEMRKVRIFQAKSYLTLDYKNQCGYSIELGGDNQFLKTPIPTEQGEPLKIEIVDFLRCVKESCEPEVSIQHGKHALKAALDIIHQIKQ